MIENFNFKKIKVIICNYDYNNFFDCYIIILYEKKNNFWSMIILNLNFYILL